MKDSTKVKAIYWIVLCIWLLFGLVLAPRFSIPFEKMVLAAIIFVSIEVVLAALNHAWQALEETTA